MVGFFIPLFARYFLVSSNFYASVSAGLKDELLAVHVEARSAKGRLEGEVALNGRLRTAINDLSVS